MAYAANLDSNQKLTIVNQGTQTSITLVMDSPGQHQSQSTGFTTGIWTAPPQLFQTGLSFVLQINSDTEQHFMQIRASGMSTLNNPPSLANAVKIDLQQIPDPPASKVKVDFESMEMDDMDDMDMNMNPMSMKLGNMSMNMNPMSMRIGNMSMNTGKHSKSSTSTKRFCTQCGQEAKQSDRFCASCGHKLKS
ncbi:MAG: hypothetical protein Tsb0014_02470 [Pleurocapsa sp.]